jgi:hypothetical protein
MVNVIMMSILPWLGVSDDWRDNNTEFPVPLSLPLLPPPLAAHRSTSSDFSTFSETHGEAENEDSHLESEDYGEDYGGGGDYGEDLGRDIEIVDVQAQSSSSTRVTFGEAPVVSSPRIGQSKQQQQQQQQQVLRGGASPSGLVSPQGSKRQSAAPVTAVAANAPPALARSSSSSAYPLDYLQALANGIRPSSSSSLATVQPSMPLGTPSRFLEIAQAPPTRKSITISLQSNAA